ncbi:MAG: DUF3786 domain-containing protein [Deltaproteobacteria bacterium]|jgi:hypothetical protein|nr:DUF3786 domain-containing protein [Deltaproteobacteria bacterium]
MSQKAPLPNGYENNYLLLAPRLAQADFGEKALALGFSPAPGGVKINFLGREYLIDKQGVEASDGQPSPANNRSLLIHYLFSPGRGGPGEKYLTLWQVPGYIRGRRNPGDDILNKPLVRAFGQDYALFKKAALTLNGRELGRDKSGREEWLFRVLPKIDMLVRYLPADEEFPVDIQTLFDELAPTYLEFECLAFLNAVLSQTLAELGGCRP